MIIFIELNSRFDKKIYKMTLSMTWMTPLLAMTSAATTLTVLPPYLTWTPPSSVLTKSMTSPPMVSTGPLVTAAAGTLAVTTCLSTITLAASGDKLSNVPSGNLAKASSDGAKTVKASAPFNVSTNPRSDTILTKVVKVPDPTATSTTS